MPTPGSKNRKRNYLDIKWLILSGALVSTLGFWGIFTRAESKTLDSAPTDQPPPAPDPGSQEANVLTIELPPMPTLVPAAVLNAAAQPNGDLALASPAPLQVVAPAAPLAPVKILLGGSKPGSGGRTRTTPVTRTRSSR